MSKISTHKSDGYAAVVLSGSECAVKEAAAVLKTATYRTSSASYRSLIVHDVRDTNMDYIKQVAAEYQLSLSAIGRRQYLDQEVVKVRKAFKLSLQPDKWYFADNLDQYPLVFVRDVQLAKMGESGDEAQIVTMELHAADGSMPSKHAADSREVASYGLRPATPDDFTDLGMIPPDSKFMTASVVTGVDNVFSANVSLDH